MAVFGRAGVGALGVFWGAVLSALVASGPAWAGDEIPDCMANGKVLGINNDQVLQWKTSTKSGYTARAHVQGTVVRAYDDRNGHAHFEVALDSGPSDTLEFVYNEDFGAIPVPTPGMPAEACGDFINSFAQNGQYAPSPDGAIIHWIHVNPSGHGHASGFLVLNGELCGQDGSDARDPNAP